MGLSETWRCGEQCVREFVRVEAIMLRATLQLFARCKAVEEEVASMSTESIARLSTKLQASNAAG
jgi:hypothetical protein